MKILPINTEGIFQLKKNPFNQCHPCYMIEADTTEIL